GALFASFHDELVQCGIERKGIITRKTGEAKTVQRFSRCSNHPFDIEVTKTVNPEIFADVFHRHLVCDQFFWIRKIDAIVACKPMWWTAHTHVHFGRASLAQVYHTGARGRAAHD